MVGKIFDKLMRVNNKRIATAALKLKKYWPDICLVLGIASGAGAVVSTAVQTTKLEPVIDEHVEKLKTIHEKKYENEADRKKDIVKTYATTAGKVGKLYALPAALEALSIGTRISGHATLKGDNLALAAAYAATMEAYKKLREKGEKIPDRKDDDEPPFDVNEKLQGCTDEKAQQDILQEELVRSPYCRVFHSGNPYYRSDLQENIAFLKMKQVELNDRFHARGFIFLNEVLEAIGMQQCEMGQIVGWVQGSGGDDFIDFGMVPIMNVKEDDGYSPSIWLDFNVDGDISYIFAKTFDGKDTFLPDRAPKEEE